MTRMVVPLERPTRVCPLGLRFWDTVTRSAVDDRLTVEAYRPGHPQRRVRAFANRSGVFAFADLPGMRSYEFGLEEAPVGSPPSLFAIDVEDTAGRFVPFRFLTPVPMLGLLPWESEPVLSPLASPVALARESPERHVPLFPAPARSAPSGMAVVRAELREPSQKPAAWAVLEVYTNGHFLGRSYADARGLVAVMFAYPEPLLQWPGSPGGGAKMSLADHEWPVQFVVRYDRLPPVPDTPRVPGTQEVRFADLGQVLKQRQTAIELDLSPVQPLAEKKLHYGRELIVRSRDANPPISHVLIAPAASPL